MAKPPTSDDNEDRLIVSGGVIKEFCFLSCYCSRCCPLVGIDDDDDYDNNDDGGDEVVVGYNDIQMT